MIKNRIFAIRLSLLSTPLFLFPLAGHAIDIGFEPRISTGVMHYDFKSKGRDSSFGTGGVNKIDYNDNLVFLGGGGTVFIERFFGDVYYQQSNDGEVFQDETPTTFGFGLKPNRRDFAASLGFNIWPNFAVFAGYKYGKTENDGNIFDGCQGFDQSGACVVDLFPNGRGFSQKFEEDGPFVGAVYGWNVFDRGTLSINLAVAYLDADTDERLQLVSGFDKRKLSGDAVGVSYGVSWSSSITQRLGYSIKINGYNYSFDDFDGTQFDDKPGNNGPRQGRDFKVDENMIGINFDISYSLL